MNNMNNMNRQVKTTNSYSVAIESKFIAPTNTKGDRIRVRALSAGGKSKMYSYDYGMNDIENHESAIGMFLHEQEWFGEWRVGGTSTGAVAVCISREREV